MAVPGFALAALVGLSLGLLGGGGSILAVPIFVYVLAFEAKQAIAMSLVVVGATSLLGTIGHWRAGHVNVRVALVFGGVAMAGTYLGARLAVFFTGAAQLALFAAVMLLAAFFMLRDARPQAERAHDTARAPHARPPLGWVVLDGVAVGVLTGLVGVGGGFLIVPALVILGRLPMKEAVGTSLLVIAMKSLAGFAGYLGQVEMPWGFLSAFTAVAAVGILAGTHLARYMPQHVLKRAFAGLLLATGAWVLYQNAPAMPGVLETAADLAAGAAASARGAKP